MDRAGFRDYVFPLDHPQVDRVPNDAPATGMVSAVRRLLGLLDDEGRETVLLPLDARQWRMWNKHRDLFFVYGLRMDEISPARDVAQWLSGGAHRRPGHPGGVELQLHHLRRAIGSGAVWVAARGPPPGPQLRDRRRPDGHLPGISRRRAQLGARGPVRGCGPVRRRRANGRWHQADQRHLGGAFRDNRVIPCEGARPMASIRSTTGSRAR
jgi:hypothetical protein